MSRILVIGGYGAFGARLSRRLAERGHDVLIAGRDIAKAVAFCAAHPGCAPVEADREHGIGMVMARHRPDLVIDAAGPFQGSGRTVPEACLAMRIPYLDLADARDFVTGIGALDREARAAGVAIVSGASSVPALSGAVARHLARRLDRVDTVDMLITTSNRASAGESVARAILSYVGRPIRLWDGKAWRIGHGWQDMRRVTIEVTGMKPLRRRVALAEVPDLDLFPAMLPGRPAVSFRAGTELGVQMLALWLLSWPVRWGWIASLAGVERVLMPLYRTMLRFGGDRSAMQVRLRGDGLDRRWSLIAERGDGPEIPTMAAELLAEDILAGRIAPGARDASGLLTLDRFEPLFRRFAIRHETATAGIPLAPQSSAFAA
ncbi:MAG TPA: saccharopine dehydrogenase NADP-binding domain-containing protein [Sphingomonas sp.]